MTGNVPLAKNKQRDDYPVWLRLTHWVNAVAVIVMIMSGWRIYNASPLFAFHFPAWTTLGGWLGGALQWHFAAMWLLVANGTAYLFLALLTGRIQTKLFPIRIKEFVKEMGLAVRGKLKHDDLTHYNMPQKVAYLVAIVDLVVIVSSGLVVWKNVQFPLLRMLYGGYDNARLIHFAGMSVLVGFILIHVALVVIVPRTLLGMIRGRL